MGRSTQTRALTDRRPMARSTRPSQSELSSRARRSRLGAWSSRGRESAPSRRGGRRETDGAGDQWRGTARPRWRVYGSQNKIKSALFSSNVLNLLVELRGFEPGCSWRCLRESAAIPEQVRAHAFCRDPAQRLEPTQIICASGWNAGRQRDSTPIDIDGARHNRAQPKSIASRELEPSKSAWSLPDRFATLQLKGVLVRRTIRRLLRAPSVCFRDTALGRVDADARGRAPRAPLAPGAPRGP